MAIGWVRKYEAQYLFLLFVLLAGAAVIFIGTRPAHLEEGDFLLHEDRRAVDEWLLGRLGSPVAETRERAVISLLRIGDAQYADRLITALADPSARVRARAAFGLGVLYPDPKSRPPAAVREALVAALDDDERVVVQYAVQSLGRMERGNPALAARILKTAAPVDVLATAIRRLGARGEAAWFVDRLDSDDPLVRWGSALAAGELLSPLPEAALPSLRKLGRDKNPWIRLAAAEAFARHFPDPEINEDLVARLSDPDPKVRLIAVRALQAHPDAPGAEQAVALVADRNPHVAAAARLLAMERGAPGVEAPAEPEPQPNAGGQPVALAALRERDYQRIARVTGAALRIETSEGALELELDVVNAPLTSWRFLELARLGAWNGQTFTVRPGEAAVLGEAVRLAASEYSPEPFVRGSIGVLARPGDHSAQPVFLCLAPQPLFDGEYTNIGRLETGDGFLDWLTNESRILSVSVIER